MWKARANSEQVLPDLPEISKQQRHSLPAELGTAIEQVVLSSFETIWEALSKAETRRALTAHVVWVGHFDSANLIEFVIEARTVLKSSDSAALSRLYDKYLLVWQELKQPAACAKGLYRLAGKRHIRNLTDNPQDFSEEAVEAVVESVKSYLHKRYFNPERARTRFFSSAYASRLTTTVPLKRLSRSSIDVKSSLKNLDAIVANELEPGIVRRLVRRYVCRPVSGALNPPKLYWESKRKQCLQCALRCSGQWRTLRLRVDTLEERLNHCADFSAASLAARLIRFADYLDVGQLCIATWKEQTQQLDKQLFRALFGRQKEPDFMEGVDQKGLFLIVDSELEMIRKELQPRLHEGRRAAIGQIPKSVVLQDANELHVGRGSTVGSIVRHIRVDKVFCLSADVFVGQKRIQVEADEAGVGKDELQLKLAQQFFRQFGRELLSCGIYSGKDENLAAEWLSDPEHDCLNQFPEAVFYEPLLRATSVHAQFMIDRLLRYKLCPGLLEDKGRIKAWRKSDQTTIRINNEHEQHRVTVTHYLSYEVFGVGQKGGDSCPLAVFQLEAALFVHSGVIQEVQLRPHDLVFSGIEKDPEACELLLGYLETVRV